MLSTSQVGKSGLKGVLNSRRLALLSILVVWALARVYPATQMEPMASWDVWQVHKMLDYGFAARHGAMISVFAETGTVPNPQDFNYTHHPYPYVWLCALVYALSGPNGLTLVAVAVRLALCAAVFLALDRYFDRFSAWCASLLYALAPILIHVEMQEPTHSAVLAATLLPLTALALGGGGEETPVLTGARRWLPAILVFALSQADWFALAFLPAVLVLNQGWSGDWRQNLRTALANPVSLGMVAAGVLSAVVFFGQVALYDPDFGAVKAHLLGETGGTQSPHSRWSLLLVYFPLRSLFFVGAPLLVGALAGLFCCRRNRSRLVLGSLVALVCLGGVVWAMPMYFFKENSLFPAFVFPAAVLTALAIQHRRKVLPWVLLVVCLPGVLEAQLYASIHWFTPSAVCIGRFVATHSAKTDMIATNLEQGRPPFDANDAYGEKGTRLTADRIIFFNCRTPQRLATIPAELKSKNPPMLFFLARSCPITPELLQQLHETGKLVAGGSIQLPHHEPTLAEKLKGFVYYHLMGKLRPPEQAAPIGNEESFEIYRLH